jgi:hypothetical protein
MSPSHEKRSKLRVKCSISSHLFPAAVCEPSARVQCRTTSTLFLSLDVKRFDQCEQYPSKIVRVLVFPIVWSGFHVVAVAFLIDLISVHELVFDLASQNSLHRSESDSKDSFRCQRSLSNFVVVLLIPRQQLQLVPLPVQSWSNKWLGFSQTVIRLHPPRLHVRIDLEAMVSPD